MPQNELIRRIIQERGLDILARNACFEFTTPLRPFFAYTDGTIGPYKVQIKPLQANVPDVHCAVGLMVQRLALAGISDYTVVTGGESGDLVLSVPFHYQTNTPHTRLWKNWTSDGAPLTGKRVLHIADVNRTGSSFGAYWKPMIEQAGGTLVHVLSFVDRCEGGTEEVQRLGASSDSVVSMDKHAWTHLKRKTVLDDRGMTSIRSYLTAPLGWAHARLTSVRGLDYLYKLFQDPATHERALKVINHYPEQKGIIAPYFARCGVTLS